MSPKHLPNTCQTPNFYIDEVMHLLTGDEFKVLMYTIRRILGFNKDGNQDYISLSQYEHGIKSRANGDYLDHGTGLSRKSIISCLQTLKRHNIIQQVDVPGIRGTKCYRLQLDTDMDLGGLEKRAKEKKLIYCQRTSNARQAQSNQQYNFKQSVCDTLVNDTRQCLGDTSVSDTPVKISVLVNGTHQSLVNGTHTQNPEETQKRRTEYKTEPSVPVERVRRGEDFVSGDSLLDEVEAELLQEEISTTDLARQQVQASVKIEDGRLAAVDRSKPFLADRLQTEAYEQVTQQTQALIVTGSKELTQRDKQNDMFGMFRDICKCSPTGEDSKIINEMAKADYDPQIVRLIIVDLAEKLNTGTGLAAPTMRNVKSMYPIFAARLQNGIKEKAHEKATPLEKTLNNFGKAMNTMEASIAKYNAKKKENS